jgi:hypothetical protein
VEEPDESGKLDHRVEADVLEKGCKMVYSVEKTEDHPIREPLPIVTMIV